MRQWARFNRQEVAFVAWVLSGLGLATASCGPSVGGIVTEQDGSGGTGGRADASTVDSDSRGGEGGAATDASEAASADATGEGGAEGGGPEPVCVYHTDPPASAIALLDEGGVDGAMDGSAGVDATIDAGASVDASGGSEAGPDATIDASLADASADISVSDGAGGGSSDASSDRGGRDGGGEAGDAGPTTSITVETSPFLGKYLADSTGRTLYTFGNDQPGDCMNLPNTDCVADCLTAWPAFDAGKRTLPSTLSDAAFGSIQRADGVIFTTYYGWPLYYYRPDTGKGVINGHGKSKTWHVATVLPAGIVIMKKGLDPRYVADGTGRTLYAYDQDTVGAESGKPVSACVGTCLDAYRPYQKNTISVVSSLEASDFTIFVRPDNGSQQLAYKGAPLYTAVADARAGDQNGLAVQGWSLVAAP